MKASAKKVFIYHVSTISSKLDCICYVAKKQFELGENLLITVPSQEAAVYVDQLLWRQPEESFLPHAIVSEYTNERIAITIGTVNLNKAKIIFNLRQEIVETIDEFDVVYDLLDKTHPIKEQQSHNRLSEYQARNYGINHINKSLSSIDNRL